VIKVIIFILLSFGAITLSREYLFNLRSHGFFRLLAFEGIVALLLLNIDKWFQTPLSLFQIMSWILLILSAGLALHGFYLLYKYGETEGSAENTTVLVRAGAYRFIRHPLYASLLFFALGVYLKSPSTIASLLVALCSLFLFLTAKVEEQENITKFGEEYLSYMESTKMFIPYIL
jgi:protein-S-isoprenylcysteine O-methyltransferase Ste14